LSISADAIDAKRDALAEGLAALGASTERAPRRGERARSA
jgi:hypothetical protein